MTPAWVTVETPPGRGAVAVVRVEGERAVGAIDGCFHAANGEPLRDQPIGAIRFGRWRQPFSEQPAGEELIVCRLDETTVEVHCHGGRAAVRAVVASLVERGCAERPWREAIGESLESETRRALADCVTDRAAAVLMDQLGGALRAEIESIAAAIDRGDCDDARQRIGALGDRASFGLHLVRPWRVVLAGPPNVGKSSLINALVGYERAIVFDQPGVTRDVVTAAAAIDGWPVELADTAGLRAPEGAIEAAGIKLARRAAAAADVLVLVEAFGSGEQPGVATAAELLDRLGLPPRGPGQGLLRVANKADLAAGAASGDALPVSATTGAGVEEFIFALGRALAPDPPPAGAAVPFTPRQVDRLKDSREAMSKNDPAAARAALQALLAGR